MSWEYRPELDGLRFVAVYLVLGYHAHSSLMGGGFIGVDLFFVLSGFLVTNVILSEVDRRGTFSIGGFYSRRVRRLLPAAVLVIAVTSLLQVLVLPEPRRITMVADARAALLYFANWQFISDANDYFGDGIASSPFLHFWSLSIEEQYYICYPLVLGLLLIKLRQSERRVAGILAGITSISIALQVSAARSDVNYAYYATQTRIYQPLLGCLVALVLRDALVRGRAPAGFWPRRWLVIGAVLGWVGLTSVLVLASGLLDLSQSLRGLLSAFAAACAIAGVMTAPQTLLGKALGLPLPVYLGRISYGTYLWHWPVLLLADQLFTVRPLILGILAAGVATGLASLSYQVFESPIRRAPTLNGFPWPVVLVGLVASTLVATLVVPTVLNSRRQPVVAQAGADTRPSFPDEIAVGLEDLNKPVPKGIDWAAITSGRGDEGSTCAGGTAASCVVVDQGRGPLVVLVGDSHAGMLSSALRLLAEERGFRFSSAVMDNCTWQSGLVVERSPPGRQADCAAMRKSFYDEILPSMGADVVILAGKPRSDGHWVRETSADDAAEHPDETYQQTILRKSQETVERIRDTGARVLIVHSIFGTGGYDIGGPGPLDCLAAAKVQADCAVIPPLTLPTVDGFYTYFSVTLPSVYVVDLRPAYCPAQVACAPIVDGAVTWKDPSHLSRELVDARRGQIWASMLESGAFDGLVEP